MANRTKRTPIKKRAILDVIAAGGTVAEAAHHAGVGRRLVFQWRTDDPDFARDFEEAYANGTDRHVVEARKRAFAGSDALLIFLLKSRDPAQFNQRMQVALGGDPAAPPIGVEHSGSTVHFYMPSNGRDQPEEIEPDEPLTIEGEAGSEDDAA